MDSPFLYKELSCGNCLHRLLRHSGNADAGATSKYARCVHRPKLKQKVNSWPKWCPLRQEVIESDESVIVVGSEVVKVKMLNNYVGESVLYVFVRKIHIMSKSSSYEYVAVYANNYRDALTVLYEEKPNLACLYNKCFERGFVNFKECHEKSLLERLNSLGE